MVIIGSTSYGLGEDYYGEDIIAGFLQSTLLLLNVEKNKREITSQTMTMPDTIVPSRVHGVIVRIYQSSSQLTPPVLLHTAHGVAYIQFHAVYHTPQGFISKADRRLQNSPRFVKKHAAVSIALSKSFDVFWDSWEESLPSNLPTTSHNSLCLGLVCPPHRHKR